MGRNIANFLRFEIENLAYTKKPNDANMEKLSLIGLRYCVRGHAELVR